MGHVESGDRDQRGMMKGSCLCGAVGIEVVGALEHAPEACHCSQCRRQTGHFFAGVNVRRDALTLRGGDKITWHRSSEKVQRGFCSVCGSVLFWQPDIQGYQYTSVAMGAFDLPTGMKLSKHIFVADKGDYYEINDGLPQSTGY
jgi:hypothetical protein